MAVGGILKNDGALIEGSWDNRPSGCYFGPEIHFNNKPNGDNMMAVQIKSAGFSVGNYASIKVDGSEKLQPSRRGLNVVLISDSGSIISARTFDTHDSNTAANEFEQFISGLGNEDVVLISVRDEAANRLTTNAKNAIREQLGSTKIDNLGYRHSWCIIGRKGTSTVIAEDHQANGVASCDNQIKNWGSPWHSTCQKMEVRFSCFNSCFSSATILNLFLIKYNTNLLCCT